MAIRTADNCTMGSAAFRVRGLPTTDGQRTKDVSVETRTMNPFVMISSRGEERIASGHPWIYRADVADVRAEGGDIVLVRTPRGRPLGRALYSSQSQIALRMLSLGEEPADEALI